VKPTAVFAAIVLSFISLDVLAQNPAPPTPGAKPEAENVVNSFKGVVVSMNPVGLIVKGEFNQPASAAGKAPASPKGKSVAQTVAFVVKGAKVTRNGWRPCEPKDLQKGETVTVTFTPPAQPRAKAVATVVDIGGELTDADKAPLLGKPGKLLFEDDFARGEPKPKFRTGKGTWEVKDGVLVGEEVPADQHAATGQLDPNFVYKDFVAEFSFKFEGSTSCNFGIDDPNYKESHAGHIARATITPTAVMLGDSKFGSMKNEIHDKMKDPQTSEDEKKKLMASIKDKSAMFKIAIEPGKWHQARVEVVGEEMLVSIDYQPVGYFKSEGIDHPTKNKVGFSVGGKFMQLDNVKVWEAAGSEEWSKSRSLVQAALRK
jgi:hypothetical protein